MILHLWSGIDRTQRGTEAVSIDFSLQEMLACLGLFACCCAVLLRQSSTRGKTTDLPASESGRLISLLERENRAERNQRPAEREEYRAELGLSRFSAARGLDTLERTGLKYDTSAARRAGLPSLQFRTRT